MVLSIGRLITSELMHIILRAKYLEGPLVMTRSLVKVIQSFFHNRCLWFPVVHWYCLFFSRCRGLEAITIFALRVVGSGL